MMLRLPQFSRPDASEDAREFLNEISMICNAFSYNSTKSIHFAIFRLNKVALQWYEMLHKDRASDVTLMTWEEFNIAFLEHFLPDSMREARTREFETLMQTPSMSMVEYSVKFTKLVRYAPYLTVTKAMQTQWFVNGLLYQLYRVVASHEFTNYSKELNYAQRLELKDMEG